MGLCDWHVRLLCWLSTIVRAELLHHKCRSQELNAHWITITSSAACFCW